MNIRYSSGIIYNAYQVLHVIVGDSELFPSHDVDLGTKYDAGCGTVLVAVGDDYLHVGIACMVLNLHKIVHMQDI